MTKIRWGVLGTGNIVAKGGAALHHTSNGEWIGVAGRNEENSRAAAERYGVPRAYSSYRECIEDPEIDAVYIALLNHLHYEWAMAAIQAGKHVLLEKPITLNAEEAEKLRRAAEESGVQLMEAFVWRFYPVFQEAKRRIEQGEIGEPVFVNGHFSFAAQPTSTRLVKEWGGGSLWDVGCYPVSWARYFFGDEPEAADCALTFDRNGVDIRASGMLHFAGGRTAHIGSGLDTPIGAYVEVAGTKGAFRIDTRSTPTELTVTLTIGGETIRETSDRITPFRLQAEYFADCALGRKENDFGGDEVVANMRALDALFKADRDKRRIPVATREPAE
jgi:predicted dehydrogenase